VPQLAVVNPNKIVRSRRLENKLRNLPRPVIWFSRLIPQTLRRSLFTHLKQANVRVERRRPLDKADRRRLQAEFAAEVKALSTLLERDLTHWSQPNE
jgi:hypothetical protein